MKMNVSEDLFADFEQTVLEDMKMLNPPKTMNLHRESLEITDLNKICPPAYRGYNLLKAAHAFKEKRYLDSVFHESAAMSIGMRYRFKASEVVENRRQLPTDGNLKDFLDNKQTAEDDIDYIDCFLNDNESSKVLKNIEFSNGTELMTLCQGLPKEWTIVQLCKQINLDEPTQTREECLQCPLPIYLTLVCYPLSERFNHQPIKIMLKPLDDNELNDLFETSYDHFKRINEKEYDVFKMKSDEFETKLLSKLKKLLGPWIVLFSGKSKTDSDALLESKIFKNVDNFATKHKFSKRQVVLTCLVARRVSMLSKEDIVEAGIYISKTKEDCRELINFLLKEKSRSNSTKVIDYNPVILVIDDLIDFFYWEMCNPGQEFTRVESIVTLLQLHAYHENKITNGYFRVENGNGAALLNPGGDLKGITERCAPLLIKSKPHWKILQEKKPTFTELQEMLSNSDIYYYCGHSTGFQFVSAYETLQLLTKAVVFLLGCSSISFTTNCGFSLAYGAHQYYHVAKSPAVIGNINLIYSTYADLEMAVTFINWLSVPESVVNDIQLPDDACKFEKLVKATLSFTRKSPYLGKVIADYKKVDFIPMTARAMFCHRGLPIYLEQ